MLTTRNTLVPWLLALTIAGFSRPALSNLAPEATTGDDFVGLATPLCGPCQFDQTLHLNGTAVDPACPQNKPNRKEYYDCHRYQCANGHWYGKTVTGYGACQESDEGNTCPNSSCIR
jgi:hypothetical protein